MDNTVVVNGFTYTIKRSENEIHLQRYNEKYKMWINVFFPVGKELDENVLIDILSDLYIKKHLPDDIGGTESSTP